MRGSTRTADSKGVHGFGKRRDRFHWVSSDHTLVSDRNRTRPGSFQPPVNNTAEQGELGGGGSGEGRCIRGAATFGRHKRDTFDVQSGVWNGKDMREDAEIMGKVDEKYDLSADTKHWRRQGSGFTFEQNMSRDKSLAIAMHQTVDLSLLPAPHPPTGSKSSRKGGGSGDHRGLFWQRMHHDASRGNVPNWWLTVTNYNNGQVPSVPKQKSNSPKKEKNSASSSDVNPPHHVTVKLAGSLPPPAHSVVGLPPNKAQQQLDEFKTFQQTHPSAESSLELLCIFVEQLDSSCGPSHPACRRLLRCFGKALAGTLGGGNGNGDNASIDVIGLLQNMQQTLQLEQAHGEDPYVSHVLGMLDEVVDLHNAAISIQSSIRGAATRSRALGSIESGSVESEPTNVESEPAAFVACATVDEPSMQLCAMGLTL